MRWYGALRRSREIAFVRRRGKPVRALSLTAYAVAEPDGRSRLAVSVPAAVGGAVTRNLVKRRIRGALDELEPPRPALRLLIVAKPAAAQLAYDRLARDVAAALGRSGASG